MTNKVRTVTSFDKDVSGLSSPDINDESLNTPSARASIANFEENQRGDQIELKYFLSFSEQFNSFKVLKKTPQVSQWNTGGASNIDELQTKPYVANYMLNNDYQRTQMKVSRNMDLLGDSQISHNASKKQSKS